MGCSTKIIKVSAIIFNIIFALLGILLIVGTALDDEDNDRTTIISSYVIGALIILFAILGCLAALRESLNIAIACTVFFLVLAITHIVLLCIRQSEKDPNEGLNVVNEAWGNDTVMNDLEIKHECCGKASPQEYINFGRPIPKSCFPNLDDSKASELYLSGCSAKVQEHYEQKVKRMLITNWVLIALELIGFFLHLYLLINFRNKQRRLQF